MRISRCWPIPRARRTARLPDTGIALDLERVLSAVCIETPGYGTRTSTVVKLYADAPAELHERVIQ